MKSTIFVLCFLCATAAAFGQTASVLNNTAQPLQMPDHVQQASQHAMAQESSLLGASAYSSAHGEQPVVDFGTLKRETPLGDIARAYRKEHTVIPKAVKVFEQ